jgi:hypothetical protein
VRLSLAACRRLKDVTPLASTAHIFAVYVTLSDDGLRQIMRLREFQGSLPRCGGNVISFGRPGHDGTVGIERGGDFGLRQTSDQIASPENE